MPTDDATGEEPIAEAASDPMSSTFAKDVESNAYNKHLDFPATSGLVPDVDGKHVLDAGCGTGLYTE